MSVEQPDALALLDIARETVLEQLLPQLDGDARYQALMIANAMAMALRELRPGAPDGELEASLLRELYGQSPAAEPDHAGRALLRLEARFAQELRSGNFNDDRQPLIRQLLRTRIESSLQVSNPRRLLREADARADSERLQGPDSTDTERAHDADAD